jgi:signal transduction histidine kinase
VLALVQRRTRHLCQIVESLLFLARADREQLQPTLETVDLGQRLAEHARTWHDSRRIQDLRLEVAEGGRYTVRAQPALLCELIDNLLDNASRYSDAGTPIRVTLRQDRSSVLVEVEDEGIGIAERDIPHVFEPFYRSAEVRRSGSPGSGLGLAIVRRLTTAFEGTITVASRPQRGTRFTISLPLSLAIAAPANQARSESPEHEKLPV